MRIIAGEWKGRRLASPKDRTIRPTSEKVKEALLSMLAPHLEDAIFVDLFAGTGGIGLEAASRGAKRVYFGDRSRAAIDLLKANIAHCRGEDRTVVLWGEWDQVLDRIREPADLVFLDPPYADGLLEECIRRIDSDGRLAREGIVAVEHDLRLVLPSRIGALERYKEKRYGKTAIGLYRRIEDAAEAAGDGES